MSAFAEQNPADDTAAFAAFGRDFLRHAVTQARVEAALANLAGNQIDFGPRKVGPGGLASIRAEGAVSQPSVAPMAGEAVRYAITLPIELELVVRLAAHDHRFVAEMAARLTLTARPRDTLRIFIDVPAPTERDVEVNVTAQGLRASVLDVVADVEGELKRVVARQIARQIDSDRIREMRDIDVAARLEKNA
ncbi:hypothetical protein [Salinisphaera sp. T31B1]|uniref:hypothetical protein n=1 Tax=Salinisphaera sp. T31B1 TaxID=727963 RepID=UPI00334214B4